MNEETPFTEDRVTRFINNTIFNSINAEKPALSPAIGQEIKKFTSKDINSALRSILNGFATESSEWNQNAIRASLAILPPLINLRKIYPQQISEAYTEAVIQILPNHPEVNVDGGLEALIEAGIIFAAHIPNRRTIVMTVVPVLKQELEKRHPNTNEEVYKRLVVKIDDLSYILRTDLVNPIDTTEIANKLRDFNEDFFYKHFSPEQFARLDLLVLEAIRDFGMSSMQIIKMSGMGIDRIYDSITRLKRSGSIPDRFVTENSLTLQVQKMLGKGLTAKEIAKALGPGSTESMVAYAKSKLRQNHPNNLVNPIKQSKTQSPSTG